MGSVVSAIVPQRGIGKSSEERVLRDELRAAIDAAKKAAAAVEHHKGSISRAEQLVEASERKVEAASSAVAAAKQEAATLIQRAASSGNGGGSLGAAGTKAARAAEVEAVDEAEATRAALARLVAQMPEVEDQLRLADNKVEAAVNAVLAPHVGRLLDEARQLRADLAVRLRVLEALCTTPERNAMRAPAPNGLLEVKAQQERDAPLAEVKEAVNDFLRRFNVRDCDRSSVASFEHFREALRVNADAPVPTT